MRYWGGRIAAWLIEGIGGLIAFWLLRWLWRAIQRVFSDAIYGWAEAVAVDTFGLTAPSVPTVVYWIVELGPPLAGVGVFFWAYHWWHSRPRVTDTNQQPAPETGLKRIISPPIGSLRYITAVLDIGHSKSSDKWAGQVQVTFENTTDKLLFYRATTAGGINGVAFGAGPWIFDGYLQPKDRTVIMSTRLVGFDVDPNAGFDQPIALAIFEYDIAYRFIEESAFSRRTTKALRIAFRGPLPNNLPVGSIHQSQTMVMFDRQSEE